MKRRGFLLTGAGVAGTLMVGWAVAPPPPRLELDRGVLPTAPGEVQLNGWLTIGADGGVGIAVPRSEMGQGVHTALPMLLAEELCCDWNRVRVIAAPVDQMYANIAILVDALPFHPDMQGALRDGAEWIVAKMARQMTPMITGGSTSVKDAWNTMRVAGACAREMLVAAAAARMGVPASQ
jgi:isoquinoline 1-oxidoreductase beta subunit